MEFNKPTTNNTAATSIPEVVADKITLVSPERVTTKSINNAVAISTTLSDSNTLLVSHDVRELKKGYNKDAIKTSLVTIYGKNNRLAASSKDVEALSIPISEFPARLEYTFTVMENDIAVEYKTDYLIPARDTSTMLSLTGKKLSSISETTIAEAVGILDTEIANIKTNLQDFSFIYDASQNKVVPLQQMITNLSVEVNTLSKLIKDVAEKIKDL